MPSHSLTLWTNERGIALDQIAGAHARIGGSQRGRRFAIEQINHAYAVLLSSQFQGFCRDLHTECVEHVLVATPANLQKVMQVQFKHGRMLERGNPHPGNLGADFNRFDFRFWQTVLADDPRNDRRRALLQELNDWRNAIAHQSFDPAKLSGRATLQLIRVRRWRRSLHHLALSFDRVMGQRLHALTGSAPW